ncbi:MAG: Ig-like domain-containing protein [Bacteroidota bacterium]
MNLRTSLIGLFLVLAIGCDTMENDVDGNALKVNNEPITMSSKGGIIDLGARIVYPGKVKVEVTTTTQHGALTDLGKGLLQYMPFKGSSKDSFGFRVFNSSNQILREDSIGIIIPGDSTSNPVDSVSAACRFVLAKNDSVINVTAAITIDVAANDSTCADSLTITIDLPPHFGTASVIGNKIHYVPAAGFAGVDYLLYKATPNNPNMVEGYAYVRIYGTNWNCTPQAVDDLFYKPLNDTSAIWLDVLANDTLCDSIPNVVLGNAPRYGYAWYDPTAKKIGYRNLPASNNTDSLLYNLCGGVACTHAWVIVKRN